MIVITGPGRSGTSLLASVYKEAGAEPGGQWLQGVNAGYEDRRIVLINLAIAESLETTMLGRGASEPPVPKLSAKLRRFVGPELRRSLRHRYRKAFPKRMAGLQPIDWSRFDATVQKFGKELRELSEEVALCKDPQFCLTLPVWLAAGAKVEHVVVTTRSFQDMVSSRTVAGHSHFKASSDLQNSLVYAWGNLMACLQDASVAQTILRFPDFLETPAETVERLPTLDVVGREALLLAFERVVDGDLVHLRGNRG